MASMETVERAQIDSSSTGEPRLSEDVGDIPKDFEPGASKDPIILSVDCSSDFQGHGGMSKSTIDEIERSASDVLQGSSLSSDTPIRTVDVSEASTVADLCPPELGALAEDWDSHAWRQQEKHVFVLSDAGKPIYCRHGSEEQLAALAGVMQALVSCIGLTGDQVRYVRAGRLRLAFLLRLPLILVAATSLPLSLQQLQCQLVYVHAQILSVVTASQLERVFSQRCNFDLRRLLAGSERFLDSLCDLMDCDPSFLLGAVRCLPLAPALRDQITQAMLKHCAKHKASTRSSICCTVKPRYKQLQ
uniref:Vacuolar fusion protein MON1 homolog n=1 Tax=Rhipicephalus zambeziensis TaxID=60191 RepID=A0A224Z9L8_9ACAR